MYSVTERKDTYNIFTLTDSSTNSEAQICPERGGILISFISLGTQLLYLDENSFYDNLKNIRGGNPILFPICGQLPNERYILNEQEYFMGNHGIARSNPWEAVDYGASNTGENGSAYLKIAFSSTLDTLKKYPFDFKIFYTYTLSNGKLTIDQSIINTTCHSARLEDNKMPIHTGFHPYFKVSSKTLCHNIKCNEYYDYNDMRNKIFTNPYEHSNKKEAILIFPENSGNLEFYDSAVPECKIRMDFSPEYKYIMIWSQDGSDFICVEPWTARNQEFLRGDELIWVEPGREFKLFMSLEKI